MGKLLRSFGFECAQIPQADRQRALASQHVRDKALNRLELSRLEPTHYHKISHNPIAIKRLMVDLFLEAHDRPPSEIILDLDATDDPVHAPASVQPLEATVNLPDMIRRPRSGGQ
jgi:hypothetical protein